MFFCDFEYDGKCLSSFDFIVCSFDFDGLKTTKGSELVFNTYSTFNGKNFELYSTSREESLTATFQICKDQYKNDNTEISFNELRELTRWLNRHDFHKFKILGVYEYIDVYFEASFNINKIELADRLIGLELTMTTNRPFALKEPKTITLKGEDDDWSKSIYDDSDEEGYIYPFTEITINKNGDLSIYNDSEKRTTLIKNCSVGEKITLDYPLIYSSLNSHKIQDDFNWNFFRISNSYNLKMNALTVSIPCTIKLRYSPIVRMGV